MAIDENKFCKKCGKPIDIQESALIPQGTKFEFCRACNSAYARPMIGLIVNFFLPGIGTIIGGDTKLGIIQFALICISLPLCLLLIGIPLLFFVYLWCILTSAVQCGNKWRIGVRDEKDGTKTIGSLPR